MSNKYQNSKIYKIVSPSHPELVYYGSTTEKLCRRMTKHRSDFKRGESIRSNEILQYEDAIILLVENYPCNNREELNKKEGEYMLNNICINKNIAGRTKKEYYYDNRDYLLLQKEQYNQSKKHLDKKD